jgi:hypothetical protein
MTWMMVNVQRKPQRVQTLHLKLWTNQHDESFVKFI